MVPREIVIDDVAAVWKPPATKLGPMSGLVYGVVVHAITGPRAGVALRVFDRRLRDEIEVGRGKSGAGGRFRITYKRPTKPIDLVVRAYDAAPVAGESEIEFRAERIARINLVIGGASYLGYSEYDRVDQAIRPALEGVAAHELATADVRYLARATGLDLDRVDAYARAARLAHEGGGSAGALYGLLRGGLPADVGALVRYGTRPLERALAASTAEHVAIEPAAATLAALRDRAAGAILDDHAHPVAAVLALSGVPRAVKAGVLAAFLDSDDAPPAIWARLAKELGDDAVGKVQLVLQLAALANGDAPIVGKLLPLATPGGLVALARLDGDAWTKAVGERGAELAAAVEDAVPTAVLAYRLAAAPDSLPHASDLARFFTANPAFVLDRDEADRFVAAHPEAIASVVDKVGFTASLRELQRLAKTRARPSEILALRGSGFTSAQMIVARGQANFVLAHAPALGTERARMIYGNATQQATAAWSLYTRSSPSFNLPLVRPLAHLDSDRLASAFHKHGLPNFSTLFGEVDFCECSDCRSIYSPAAYFVDLLHTMLDDGALAILDRRRPDLVETQLSCANTNTELPYIDLVNEILEQAVSPRREPPPGPSPPRRPTPPSRPTPPGRPTAPHRPTPTRPRPGPVALQTTWTTTELLAHPEHLNAAAYDLLKRERYPWTLPFDLAFEEGGIYLHHLGIERADLMETFARTSEPGVASAGVRLGLVPDDFTIITAGLHELAPVRVATTAPIALAGLQVIDGVAVVAGDRVLVAHQGQSDDDGVYLAAAGAWARTAIAPELWRTGLLVPVQAGARGPHVLALTLLGHIPRPGTPTAPPQPQFSVFAIRGSIDATTVDPWVYWNRTTDYPAGYQLPVDEVLSVAGLTYDELLDVLASDYVNPHTGNLPGVNPASIVFLDATCRIDRAILANPRKDTLARLHRFTRLRRKLGWTVPELDAAIRAFAPPDLTAEFVVELAGVRALADTTGTSLASLLSWWSALDTRPPAADTPSFYDTIFQNNTIFSEEERAAFALDATRRELAHAATSSWRDRRAAICAALAISAADLELLAEPPAGLGLAPVVADGALSLANLSGLYRAVSLCRALHLDIRGGRVVQALTGIDPFESPGNARALAAALAAIHASPFSLDELDELLRCVPPQQGPQLYSPDTAVVVLAELQAGLARIAVEHAPTPDPSGEATRRALESALPARDLDEILAIVDGLAVPGTAADQRALLEADLVPLLGAAAVAAIEAAVGADARRDALRIPVLGYLQRAESEGFVIQKLAGALGVDVGAAKILVNRDAMTALLDPGFVQGPAITATAPGFDPLWRLLLRLAKAARLLTRFALELDEIAFTLDGATAPLVLGGDARTGWIDLASLPLDLPVAPVESGALFAAWRREAAVFRFRDRFAIRGAGMFQLVQLAATTPLAGFATALAAAMGASATDIVTLVGPTMLDLAYPSDFITGDGFGRLLDCATVLERLGVSAAQVVPWAYTWEVTARGSADLQSAAKAKYEPEAWLAVARPLRNALRIRQRDALVAWLTSHRGFADDKALFDHYLIDVEMGPCMLTSRLKQAISSTQLFIQRALMNLEGDRLLSADHAKMWTWMGRYRYWQANREVLLYPENWIDPELRDDKTPFFDDLQTELNQAEVTPDSAEEAFRHYLESLDQVAHLQVVATCEQITDDGALVHVLARTRGEAPSYFYRTLVSAPYTQWSPWERIDLDIEGQHHLLVVWNRRLHLVWAIFHEKSEDAEHAVITDVRTGPIPGPSRRWYEIQLAWSERKAHTWTAKRISRQSPDAMLRTAEHEPLTTYSMTARTVTTDASGAEDLQVGFHPHDSIIGSVHRDSDYRPFYVNRYNSYRFAGCGGDPTIEYDPTLVDREPPAGQSGKGQWLQGASVLDVNVADVRDATVLDGGGTDFELVFGQASDDLHFDARGPFFFQNAHRCFYARATLATREVADREQAQPGDAVPQVGRGVTGEPHPISPGDVGPVSGTPELAMVRSATVSSFRTVRTPVVSFTAFHHPYTCNAIALLNRFGLDGLLDWRTQVEARIPIAPNTPLQLYTDAGFPRGSFETLYKPRHDAVAQPFPADEFDFASGGAYAGYNWELFFHAPLLIATRLSQNQQFEAAQRWFHRIFDPTDMQLELGTPQHFWKVKKFFTETSTTATVQQILTLLDSGGTSPDATSFLDQVRAYLAQPFDPFAIARLRTVAFQKATVMMYLDNLIAWGDYLFRQDTIESINEATLLYVLAAEILGPRPRIIKPPATPADTQTYHSLAAEHLDALSDALVALENYVPTGIVSYIANPSGGAPRLLFFCIPGNDRLFGYWDTVADRLFKIRNCMNIEGVVQELPLFEPPIDPALLVRAAAAGVDLGSVLGDLGAPLPVYRFQTMTQKATEVTAEVRALGQAMLAALEKRDAEDLALLRATQEVDLLALTREMKVKAVAEAVATHDALVRSQAIAKQRKDYYDGLIKNKLIASETLQLAKLQTAQARHQTAYVAELQASVISVFPNATFGVAGMGGTPESTVTFGSSNLVSALRAVGAYFTSQAGSASHAANRASINAAHTRRAQEWRFQSGLADSDDDQIGKQIAAAEVRIELARTDLANHDARIEQATEARDRVRDKFTNQQLYGWMVGQLAETYFKCYQLAYDLAKRAEKTFEFELRDDSVHYIQFGYWDGLKQGLLAGDRLYYDLKRMEAAYLEKNRREYEITKHVSLAELDPVALVQLRETGVCFLQLTELELDRDYPGHYLRRLKSVATTIPCQTGPYTSVNCTLTLVKHELRVDPSPTNSDLVQNLTSIQSVVTSSGLNDGGTFEVNLRDERYLPFEGAGAIGLWRIELYRETNRIDPSTLTDVVLHLRYTARDGGALLAAAARSRLGLTADDRVASPPVVDRPLARLFSARQDFPDAFQRFLHPADDADAHELALDLSDPRFPAHDPAAALAVVRLRVFASLRRGAVDPASAAGLAVAMRDPSGALRPDPAAPLAPDPLLGGLHAAAFDGGPLGAWTVRVPAATIPTALRLPGTTARLDPDKLDDVGILCEYRIEPR